MGELSNGGIEVTGAVELRLTDYLDNLRNFCSQCFFFISDFISFMSTAMVLKQVLISSLISSFALLRSARVGSGFKTVTPRVKAPASMPPSGMALMIAPVAFRAVAVGSAHSFFSRC